MENTRQACEIAQTPDVREEVYRTRYDCYSRKGSIGKRDDCRFSDAYDELPGSFSFVLRNADRSVAATVRLTVVRHDLGWSSSPAGKVFGDHPGFQAVAAESYVEASRLCFAQQARRDSFIWLLGNMAAMAEYWKLEWLVACPRFEHTEVYQRLFGFQVLAEPRKYYGVDFQTQLLGIRTAALGDYVRSAKPMRAAWLSALQALSSQSTSVREQPRSFHLCPLEHR